MTRHPNLSKSDVSYLRELTWRLRNHGATEPQVAQILHDCLQRQAVEGSNLQTLLGDSETYVAQFPGAKPTSLGSRVALIFSVLSLAVTLVFGIGTDVLGFVPIFGQDADAGRPLRWLLVIGGSIGVFTSGFIADLVIDRRLPRSIALRAPR